MRLLLWIGSCLPVPPPFSLYHPLIIGTSPLSSVPAPYHRYQPLIIGTSPLSSVPPPHRRYQPLIIGTTPSSSVPPTRCRCRRYHPLVVGTACSLPVPPARCQYQGRWYQPSAVGTTPLLTTSTITNTPEVVCIHEPTLASQEMCITSTMAIDCDCESNLAKKIPFHSGC
ncbi:hypothetical protein MJO28_011817 [Puccinia striiformis f. sp. tritici]|uniref:Uncharacterized protein n=1 Tax=Puccinia striiformis f. sp. tritici TaxID=168172 RepID=A0ACC0E4T3_9BASI|nr:hypothetical protein MJO28_011817 [Puccinia striiformis f. sp. tritici]KAI7947049.1 hypothetical protein MJO29_011576 [Puccinia striiformis f. sp. tritici]